MPPLSEFHKTLKVEKCVHTATFIWVSQNPHGKKSVFILPPLSEFHKTHKVESVFILPPLSEFHKTHKVEKCVHTVTFISVSPNPQGRNVCSYYHLYLSFTKPTRLKSVFIMPPLSAFHKTHNVEKCVHTVTFICVSPNPQGRNVCSYCHLYLLFTKPSM